jgi:hypothetical protein
MLCFYIYMYASMVREFWTFRHRDVSAPFIQIVVNCHFYRIKHIFVQVPNRRCAETSCTLVRGSLIPCMLTLLEAPSLPAYSILYTSANYGSSFVLMCFSKMRWTCEYEVNTNLLTVLSTNHELDDMTPYELIRDSSYSNPCFNTLTCVGESQCSLHIEKSEFSDTSWCRWLTFRLQPYFVMYRPRLEDPILRRLSNT